MFTFNTFQKSLAVSLLVLFFTGCNQQEFYEKEFLEGVGVPEDTIEIPEDIAEEIPDTKIADNSDGGLSDGGLTDAGSTDGGSTTGGSTTGGSTTGGSGSTGGSTDGGSTSGGSTDGGSTSGGSTDGGSTDGGSTSGGSTSGGSTDGGSTDGGSTDGGSTDGGSTDGGDPQPGVCGDGTLTNANDTFVQNTAQEAAVDILWVVDNSGSMGDEQDELAYNFDVFIRDFITRNIDFQMAITTTDGRDAYSGKMVGDSSKLTDEAARANQTQFLQDFKDMIKVGTRGSGTEMGLETSKDFLSQYQSWGRENAYLVVVYISDEQDSSPEEVQNYINFLQAIKPSAGMVKAYSIVTQDLDPNKRWETLGTRYEEVSNATGGEIANIHADFYTTLSNFGFKILELLDSFPLSGVPVDSQIEITINGTAVTSGWTYDANARVIKFDRNAIPNEGSIVIAYYQKCVGP